MPGLGIHCVNQESFEGAAAIFDWAGARGHRITETNAYQGESYPPQSDFDLLVLLGGPMSVHDTEERPWLVGEKQFIQESLAEGKVILGLCLGAQLLAEALGGTVQRNRVKEIGWHRVRLSDAGQRHPCFEALPGEFWAFQWHGDTFSIPPGAVHVATNDACANQAFAYGERALGLQFHFEYTEQSIRDIMAACPEELAEDGPCIGSAEDMLAHPERIQDSNALLFSLLDRLAVKLQ